MAPAGPSSMARGPGDHVVEPCGGRGHAFRHVVSAWPIFLVSMWW